MEEITVEAFLLKDDIDTPSKKLHISTDIITYSPHQRGVVRYRSVMVARIGTSNKQLRK